MTTIKDLVLYPNHIKKLLETKTPKGRNASMNAECGVFEKIFLNNKKKDNSNFEKYFLGYFDSLGYSKPTIKNALRFLEKMGFIKRSIKTISTGKVVRRILYIKLELENIVVALKEKGLSEVCIMDKKLSINKRKHTTYAINKCGTLKDTTINNVKNNINNTLINPYINSNNTSNISNSTFSDTNNIPNNTNILTNINNIPMEYIQSPTPIKKPSIYKKNNNICPLGDKNGGGGIELWQLEGIEIEAREALIKSGLKFENATVRAISAYLHLNIKFMPRSKKALKSYTKKMVDSLHKIQLEFKEAGISTKNLPTGYEPKYKSFTYQAQSIEADNTLLNKINELAKTNFNLSVLETSIYNSYGTFSKPEYLINYLVQCFKKQPNAEQYHTPESTYPSHWYQTKTKEEEEREKEASRLRTIEWLNKYDEEQRAKDPNHKSWHERYDY